MWKVHSHVTRAFTQCVAIIFILHATQPCSCAECALKCDRCIWTDSVARAHPVWSKCFPFSKLYAATATKEKRQPNKLRIVAPIMGRSYVCWVLSYGSACIGRYGSSDLIWTIVALFFGSFDSPYITHNRSAPVAHTNRKFIWLCIHTNEICQLSAVEWSWDVHKCGKWECRRAWQCAC